MFLIKHIIVIKQSCTLSQIKQTVTICKYIYPPRFCGRTESRLSSTFSVVRFPNSPIESGRDWSWLVVRWRSANEMQPSISDGRVCRQFLQPSKNISCFKLPMVCNKMLCYQIEILLLKKWVCTIYHKKLIKFLLHQLKEQSKPCKREHLVQRQSINLNVSTCTYFLIIKTAKCLFKMFCIYI